MGVMTPEPLAVEIQKMIHLSPFAGLLFITAQLLHKMIKGLVTEPGNEMEIITSDLPQKT